MIIGSAWWLIAYAVIAAVVALAFIKRGPKNNDVSKQEPNFSSVTEGTPIRIIYGTRDIKDVKLVWWGDQVTVPNKKKSGKKG